MSSTLRFTVDSEQDGQRIDKFLQQQVEGMSRSQAQKWLAAGQVLVQGKAAGKNDKLKAGMQVEVCLPETALAAQEEDGDECNWGELLAPAEEPQPQQIPLQIVYEDEHLLVVNKPKGMVVHPAPGNPDGTLVNALLWHCKGSLSGIGGEIRPGIVHRIDKDTSGLVLAAKNGYAAPLLARNVEKLYYAVVEGELPLGKGVIDAPIGRQAESIIGRCVTPDGKPSRTEYTIIRAEHGLSLAACVPVTGRTHQIRVHFASIGHPLAGDDLYGGSRERIGRQALHCAEQRFRVPEYEMTPEGIRITAPPLEQSRAVTVKSPLPPDLRALFGEDPLEI